MNKPRIFLGSSGKQAGLLQSLTEGLSDVAHVEAWTTVFNPGVGTLERLVELTREVDFAAFIFAQDDWTSVGAPSPDTGQASPRDNVVFGGGLVRRSPRNAADVHSSRQRRKIAQRSAWTHLRSIRW